VNGVARANFDEILKDIKPTYAENEKVLQLSGKSINIINRTAREEKIPGEAVLVGSVAKGTWLSGKADIDIFIKFPLHMDEKDLKKYGLILGRKCIKMMNGVAEERYASHPYVTGLVDKYEIDFVPCYAIKDGSQLKSAVDRTILHTEYVVKNLKSEQKDQVLLLKKFMESVGTYGSEFKVGGFAGYLCELLVLHYGSFIKVLEAAADEWRPGCVIDLEEYQTGKLFREPFVFVDPVDEKRNVASPLTLQKLSEFVVASRNFLENASSDYFSTKIPKVKVDIKKEFDERGTKTLLLVFNPPNIPTDAIYPQLKKTEKSLVKIIEREDFGVFGSDSWTDEDAMAIILLEFDIWTLPLIKKHYGPFIWSKNHQKRFLEKYGNDAWIEGDRWVVEVERKHTDIESILQSILIREKINYLKFGKHVKVEILNNHYIMDVSEFLESECDEKVLIFFHRYLNKSMCLWR
jgi:tRNA nucleotidyltransferase (CCA-adding enzyme)